MSSIYRIVLAGLLLLAFAATFATSSDADSARARAARRQSMTDTAVLSKTYIEGPIVFEKGQANGTLAGFMRATLNTNAPLRASFTLRTQSGTLRGHGSAALCERKCVGHLESFRGSLVIDGGSGRYAHAHGRGGLYGVFNRDTYGVEVQTTGTLSY